MNMTSSPFLVFCLIACSLVATADALWLDSGSHRLVASAGDGKPERSYVFSYNHVNSANAEPRHVFSYHVNSGEVTPAVSLGQSRVSPADVVDVNSGNVSPAGRLKTCSGMTPGDFFLIGASLLTISLVAPSCIVANAAFWGDVRMLRWAVSRGDINKKTLFGGSTALLIATFMGRPAAVRFLLEEGAETYTWTRGDDTFNELEVARRRLVAHTEYRSRKGPAWELLNPPHQDSKLSRLSECVALLKAPAKVVENAARDAPKALESAEPSAARWWLCFLC